MILEAEQRYGKLIKLQGTLQLDAHYLNIQYIFTLHKIFGSEPSKCTLLAVQLKLSAGLIVVLTLAQKSQPSKEIHCRCSNMLYSQALINIADKNEIVKTTGSFSFHALVNNGM